MSLQAFIEDIAGPFIEPKIIIEASVPIELSGEHVRGRICTFVDEAGLEWALRPDLTLPVAIEEVELRKSGKVSGETVRGYSAPIFRLPALPQEPVEYLQVGYERFGRKNSAAADADLFVSLIKASEQVGAVHGRASFGDIGLFAAFVEGLGLDQETSSGLKRAFRQEGGVTAFLKAREGSTTPGLLTTLSGLDRDGVSALVDDIFALTGVTPVGLRGKDEVVDRLHARARTQAEEAIPEEKIALLRAFLSVKSSVKDLEAAFAPFLEELEGDVFENRLSRLKETFTTIDGADCGDWLAGALFDTSFGRRFAYYDGLVFECSRVSNEVSSRPFAAGGRYDSLLADLSAGAVDETALGGVIIPHRLYADLEAQS